VAEHCTNKAHICSLVGDVFLKDARIVESNKQRQSLLEAYYVTFCSYTKREITEESIAFQGEEQLSKIPKFFITTSEFRERCVMLDEVSGRRT
jgi:hypothetical protein